MQDSKEKLCEVIGQLRNIISPDLAKHFNPSESNSDQSDSLFSTLEKFSEYQNSNSSKTNSSLDETRILNLRKKVATIYSVILQSLANVRPYYRTSSETKDLFQLVEAASSKTDDFEKEFAFSRMWHPLAQINSRLQRSILILNKDPTVIGSVPFNETGPIVQAASEQAFRDFYMENLTENYGDDLDKLRKEEGLSQARLEMLIDSLESGMSLFPESDRNLLILHNE